MEHLLFYLMLGACTGVLAGLFGVGGGLVMVPVMVYLFQAGNMPESIVVHMAIGTSLATIMLTSVSSVYAHHRHGAVLWAIWLRLIPGILMGALLGAAIADLLSSQGLRRVFGVFELLVGAHMALVRTPAPHATHAAAGRSLPGPLGMGLAGSVIGSVSAIIGIGGGTLTVPFLAWCNIPLRKAVATSAACGLPIAIAGTLGFIITGWHTTAIPYASGYVYWPAFAAIGIASMLFAPVGAHLAHTLPVPMLRRMLALLLVGLGVRMLVV